MLGEDENQADLNSSPAVNKHVTFSDQVSSLNSTSAIDAPKLVSFARFGDAEAEDSANSDNQRINTADTNDHERSEEFLRDEFDPNSINDNEGYDDEEVSARKPLLVQSSPLKLSVKIKKANSVTRRLPKKKMQVLNA